MDKCLLVTLRIVAISENYLKYNTLTGSPLKDYQENGTGPLPMPEGFVNL